MSKNNYLQTHFFPPQTYLCITLHPLNPHRSPPYSLSQLYVLPQKSYHGTAQHAPPSARPLALQWFVVEGNLNITLSARQTLRLSHPSSFEPSPLLVWAPSVLSERADLTRVCVSCSPLGGALPLTSVFGTCTPCARDCLCACMCVGPRDVVPLPGWVGSGGTKAHRTGALVLARSCMCDGADMECEWSEMSTC